MSRIEYRLAFHSWDKEGALAVFDESGQRLLVLPLEFVRSGGCNTHLFLYQQISNVVEEEGFLLYGQERLEMSGEGVPSGRAIYVRKDGKKDPCILRKGPQFKYKSRAPTSQASSSTMSDSKRSSVNQTYFRMALLARDGTCLLTEAFFEDCTACHILPQSRPEYYEQVLGMQTNYLFDASFGLLLRDDIHHRFDRGDIALYVQDEEHLVVHVFNIQTQELRQLHGNVLIVSDRFRGPRSQYPDVRLLRFHYQQCVIKYLRGYSSGF